MPTTVVDQACDMQAVATKIHNLAHDLAPIPFILPLSLLVKVWDILHLRNTGDLGFDHMCSAIEATGIVIINDIRIGNEAPTSHGH